MEIISKNLNNLPWQIHDGKAIRCNSRAWPKLKDNTLIMDDAKQTRKVDAIDCLGAGMTTFYIIL